MVLDRREIFRQCSNNFDYEEITHYDERKVRKIMETPGMIHSPRGIQATITNARAYPEIIQEYGSFDKFLWSYTDGKAFVYKGHQQYPIASSDMSDAASEELKKGGFRYLGSVTVYPRLQAYDMINDHEESHFLYRQLCDGNSMEYRN